jgi:hypothetical protein
MEVCYICHNLHLLLCQAVNGKHFYLASQHTLVYTVYCVSVNGFCGISQPVRKSIILVYMSACVSS